MVSVAAREDAARALAGAGIEDAALEARFLAGAADDERALAAYVARRIGGEPTQYIIGEWEFYGLTVFTAPGVLIPRPDTELMVDAAVGFLRACPRPAPAVLELGCGSGCIAAAVAVTAKTPVTAMDISPAAVELSRRNAARCGADVRVLEGDIFGFENSLDDASVDLIISNPPYLDDADMACLQREVRREPAQALYGGADGLDFYKYIAPRYLPKLRDGGGLIFEIGNTQAGRVTRILKDNGYKNIEIKKDYGGRDRVVTSRR